MNKQELNDRDLALKLFVVLTKAHKAIAEAVTKDIRKTGLNPTEFAVLELLYHKGEQPIQKIGKKVLISGSSITYVIDKLEEKQYIERRACPKDRRVTYVLMTESGRQMMRSIFPAHAMTIEEILDGLNKKEKEDCIILLKKLGIKAEGWIRESREPDHT